MRVSTEIGIMTKADLIEGIVNKTGLTRVKAELVVNTIFDSIKEALDGGGRVEIRDFGCFEMRDYKAYKGRNPKTGQFIEVKEKRVPFFRVGKNLRKKIGNNSASAE